MQLNNDLSSFEALFEAIRKYYKVSGDRAIKFISYTPPNSFETFEVEFLLDRKHICKYLVTQDRWGNVAGVELAIGPYYFGPADFWSYENSERFTMEASTEGVEKNLRLLDEFLGYPLRPLFTP